MSSAVANSRAAADWASKRKAALERAARIKAERETLRATEKQENEQQPESSSTVQHGRRTLGTLAPAGADDDYGLQRSFSAAAGGQQQMERRSSGEELPMRPTTDSRPQWARDLARGPPPPQFHDEYDDRSSSPAGPAGWDWYREPGGGDDAAAAAAASRFPRNLPLNQSDGGIGFNRQRNQPRAGLAEQLGGAPPPPPPYQRQVPPQWGPSGAPHQASAADDFFGMGPPPMGRRGSSTDSDANAFFGFDGLLFCLIPSLCSCAASFF